jgi:antitoxin YefM
MNILNYTQFRSNLKPVLDNVVADNDLVIINRGENNNAVIISLDEYNSLIETIHLLGTKKNAKRLYDAIERDKKSEFLSQGLKED